MQGFMSGAFSTTRYGWLSETWLIPRKYERQAGRTRVPRGRGVERQMAVVGTAGVKVMGAEGRLLGRWPW